MALLRPGPAALLAQALDFVPKLPVDAELPARLDAAVARVSAG